MQIKLNFIPQQSRRQQTDLVGEEICGMPGEIVIGCGAALIGLLLVIHVLLAGVTVWKFAAQKVLQVRWSAMAEDKKIFDGISTELNAIQAKMAVLRPITSLQELRWSRLLNDLSDSVPKGVWLRSIVFEKGVLTVSGSAVSKINNEMAEAGNFVAAIRDKDMVKAHFTGLDIDSIQRRENVAVSVADFVLKAKQK